MLDKMTWKLYQVKVNFCVSKLCILRRSRFQLRKIQTLGLRPGVWQATVRILCSFLLTEVTKAIAEGMVAYSVFVLVAMPRKWRVYSGRLGIYAQSHEIMSMLSVGKFSSARMIHKAQLFIVALISLDGGVHVSTWYFMEIPFPSSV